MRPLTIEGAWVRTPPVHRDHRGGFHEWFRDDEFRALTGRPARLVQADCSVSKRGAVRGIHFADVPPGRATFVTCVAGRVLDVVVDLRLGSTTFGQWEAVPLGADGGTAVYLSEGLGHAFQALTADATVVSLRSARYRPDVEHAVNPLDPALGIKWPYNGCPLVSERDAAAPTLARAEELGILPLYGDCLRSRSAAAGATA
ncbi:dTDP-4-dehydrorhamnose 3,5-epimerase [Actinobacteria bacterium OK074]|nr:dTDP-4-dehydrorhamnose 3,5-epimerase [Actinobacteria bacterium OK074]